MRFLKLSHIFILLSFCMPFTLIAQSSNDFYANEWINHDQSYYKIKVGDDALYRISYEVLKVTDFPLSVEGFQLYKNGQQIPIYTSNNEILQENDYIEFFGQKNDGKFDIRLYQEEGGQLNPYKSLFSDTATYYLTWNNEEENLRIQHIENDINLSEIVAQETYFMHEVLLMPDKKNQSVSRFSRGKPTMLAFRGARSQNPDAPPILSRYNYADFENGEGLVDSIIDNNLRKYGILTPAAFNGINAPMAELKLKVVGRNDDEGVSPDHHIRVDVNGVNYLDATFDGYETPSYTIPVLTGGIAENVTQVVVESVGDLLKSPEDDWQSVAYLKLRYPRTFDFKPYADNDFVNSNQFEFELMHNNVAYLEIEGFSGGGKPVVYDLTNQLHLIPNIKNGKYRIALPAGENINVSRKLIISATETVFNDLNNRDIIIESVPTMEAANFTNFQEISSQGDYIMIYSSKLQFPVFDPIEGYVQYRRSENGGSHQVVPVSIEELYDQFAYGITKHPLSVRNFVNFAVDHWNIAPEYLLLIGKSIDYRDIALNPSNNYHECLIPSYGSPPSDNMLTVRDVNNSVPQLKVGRIPARTTEETYAYMDKVIIHEARQREPDCTKEDRLWTKRVLHPFQVSNEDELSYVVNNVLNPLKKKIEESAFGGKSQRFEQIGQDSEVITNTEFNSLLEDGAALVTYWGHLDGNWRWQFDLWKTNEVDSTGKFAFFAPICDHTGQIHKRMTGSSTQSQAEEYILEGRAGAIGYLGGVSYYEDFDKTKDFHIRFYELLSTENYGKSVGTSLQQLFEEVSNSTTEEDMPYAKLAQQHLTYVGDPAICLFAGEKSDYVVEEEDIRVLDSNDLTVLDKVTPFMSEFIVSVVVSNLGKASNDSITIDIVRTLSNNEQIKLMSKKVLAPTYQQSYNINVPNNVFEGDGINDISVSIDQEDNVIESCEDNNYSKKTLQIEGNCEMSESIAELEEAVIMNEAGTAFLDLNAINDDYGFEWSNGSTGAAVELTEQGIYTVNITDELGCNVEKTFKVYPNDLVYPGDANSDGFANIYDLLTMGLNYGYQGEERTETDILNWNGQPAFNWNLADTIVLDTKHSDSDGNGTVNEADIVAIKANYNQVIGKQLQSLQESEAALYVEATDTIIPGYEHVFAVNLGTENKPAEDIYGIAFTAEFTLANVEGNDTVQLNAPMAGFSNSWLGEQGINMMAMDTIIDNTFLWDVALTRTNHENKTNYGRICKLGCVMVIGSLKSAGERIIPIDLVLKDVVVTRSNGTKFQLKNSKHRYVIAEQVITDIDDVENPFVSLELSPNPASGLVYLDFKDYQPQSNLTQINLYNLTGQLLHSQEKTIRSQQRVALEIEDLPQGIYWVQIANGTAQTTKKLVVAK